MLLPESSFNNLDAIMYHCIYTHTYETVEGIINVKMLGN